MSRNYLSKDEREHIIIGYVGNTAIDWLLAHGERYMSSDEKKYVKMAKTFFTKYTQELAKRINPVEFSKMEREFIAAHVKLERKGFIDQKGKDTLMTQEDVHDLAGAIMASCCEDCHLVGHVAAECSIGRVFRKAQVPTIEDTECPQPDSYKEIIDVKGEHTRYRTYQTYSKHCPYRLEREGEGDV